MGSISAPAEVDISVALAPCDLPSVPGHVKNIHTLVDAVSNGDEAARLAMLASARSLVNALEKPRETMIKHCWAQPTNFLACTYGVDSGLFALMAKQGPGPHKVDDLAAALGHDPRLLARIMRHLAAMGHLHETGPGAYRPTRFTDAVSNTVMGAGYPCISGSCMQALARFHEFARANGYQSPDDVLRCPLQYGYGTELDCFAWFAANPPYARQFGEHMGAYRQGRPHWMDEGFYPVRERLLDGFDREAGDGVLLTDVGGSFGHDIDEFVRKFPDAPGRLVLQDLPAVIADIDGDDDDSNNNSTTKKRRRLDPRIERLGHDFFCEQPVRGARAYYLHSVLHDWPDARCGEILARLTAAMTPGYSRLLVNENCLPDVGADWQNTGQDLMMLTLVASRERTEADWRALLEGAGLRVNHIYSVANGVESLIECELA